MKLWLFKRFCLRPLRSDPLRVLSLCLAVALAVSVLLAIVYSSRAAVSSFERVVGLFNTERNAIVRAPYGKDLIVAAPDLLPLLSKHSHLTVGSEYLASLVEQDRYRDITLLAIDMLSALGVNSQQAQDENSLLDIYTTVRTRRELRLSDQIKLALNDRVYTLRLRDLPESLAVSDGVLLLDIATAARLIGNDFKLQFVALDLAPQELDRLAPIISKVAPDCTLEAAQSRTNKAKTLYAAFELNITMMVLVAFLVTIFTIYTSALLAAGRRRQEVAVLRTLGLSSGEIFLQLQIEAILIGALGGALGAVLGRPLTAWAASRFCTLHRIFTRPVQPS